MNRCLYFVISIIIFTLAAKTTSAYNADSLSVKSIDSSKVKIIKKNGLSDQTSIPENYYQTASYKLDNSFCVIVKQDSISIPNWPVEFKIISTPNSSKGTKLTDTLVYTNKNGIAEVYATLGSVEGVYEFSARIYNSTGENDIVYFKSFARKGNWVFYLLSGIFGGLGIFLFGMDMMSKALRKATGNKLRSILSTITNNRIMAVGVGTIVTMVIQSSSATTVLLVSFVQAQLMTFAQSLGIILGAGIGSTITAQLIAFKITDYALLVIGFGFLIYFFSKSKKVKNIGSSILGFGLLFFGMWIMSSSMQPLRTYEPFIHLLRQLENPILGILIGTIFTALIQSSGAFAGIIIVLGSQGFITLEAAIPLIFGANIGTCVTALLAGINANREAKRVAIAHTLFKVFGVLIFILWIPQLADFVRSISPLGDNTLTGKEYLGQVVPRQIANAHTIFNITLTLIILPFINYIADWIVKIFPDIDEADKEQKFQTQFLEESLISTPALALSLSKAEIIQMAKKVQNIVDKVSSLFFNYNDDLVDEIKDQETEINYLNVHISKYLMKISQESLAEERTDEIFQMVHCVTELEQIGDIVSKRLIPLSKKKNKLNVGFSEVGETEIKDFHLRTMKQISRAIIVFKDVNLKSAKRMEKKYNKYRLIELDSRRTHFDRLRDDVPETIATNQIHLELMELLKRISSHATNIARIFLEVGTDNEEEVVLKARLSRIRKNKNESEVEISDEENI
ncbi:MAG: Na/Pi cotransporter family protein [Melioribacteraceae bacterium]|nr:Na/Pi cotransporter family protein [Melioribacteraceae bacterium]